MFAASLLSVGAIFGFCLIRKAEASENTTEEWSYIVVGGGASAHYAVTSIRERDSAAKVALLTVVGIVVIFHIDIGY